jgi:hypothetical protein
LNIRQALAIDRSAASMSPRPFRDGFDSHFSGILAYSFSLQRNTL